MRIEAYTVQQLWFCTINMRITSPTSLVSSSFLHCSSSPSQASLSLEDILGLRIRQPIFRILSREKLLPMERRTVYIRLFFPTLDSKTPLTLLTKSRYASTCQFAGLPFFSPSFALVGLFISLLTSFSQNPVKKIRRNGFIAICTVSVLYILTVVAYYSAGKW